MILNTLRQTLLICSLLQIGGVFFAHTAQAQFVQKQPVSTSEIGIGIGGTNYNGEISPGYRLGENQPAMTVFYRHDISAPITLRAGLLASHRLFRDYSFRDIDQDLPFHTQRNLDLRLSLFEFSVGFEYNFLDYYADIRQKYRVSPYFFAGGALLNYNRQLLREGEVVSAFDNTFAVSIPFGVGVKYALSKHWNLGLEFGARKMFSDGLDFLDASSEASRANPHDKDMYFYNGISLSYTLYRLNCPPVYKRKAGLLD